MRLRPTMPAPQTRPSATVNRSRLRSATDEPLIVLDMPPPNISERPPPLPLCSRTNRVRSSPLMTNSTCSPIFTEFTKVRPNLIRRQSVAPNAAKDKHYLTVLIWASRRGLSGNDSRQRGILTGLQAVSYTHLRAH